MAPSGGPMVGKVCLVTGATHGIGRVSACELARMGATVVVHGRNLKLCEETLHQIRSETGNDDVGVLLADLSSLSEVRALAERFMAKHQRLDVLINNAGAVFLRREETVDGYEMTFGLNHLSHFLLTNLLLDTLKKSAPSRIINVSSRAHEGAKMDFADLQMRRGYFGMRAYSRSKLANVLFTYELARRLEGTQVTANALHPGFVASNFGMNNMLMKLLKPIIGLVAIDECKGAQTSIYLASSPDVAQVSGKYFVERKAVESSKYSYDAEAAKKLWEVSEQLSGLNQTMATTEGGI
jgi:retinol dehydrogenase 12